MVTSSLCGDGSKVNKVVMHRVFGINLFHKLFIGLWKAVYYKSFIPRFGGIDNYNYCKLGIHFKGYLFEIIWTK